MNPVMTAIMMSQAVDVMVIVWAQIAYFRRPSVEAEVIKVMRPTFANEYFLINGDVGVGKSRLVLEVKDRGT